MFFRLCWLLLIIPVTSIADELDDVPDSGFWSVQIENDIWGSNDDRFYTHGAEITYASFEDAPQFLKNITDVLPFYHKGDGSVHGYFLGQKIFTPANITETGLLADDRPYAGWLFVGAGIADVFRRSKDEDLINGIYISLGVVGPASYAEQVQESIHDLLDSDVPQGWDNQLENELGFNVYYARKLRDIYNLQPDRQFEFSHHYVASIGNVYTYASTGIMLRWGSHLGGDVGPPSISPGFPGLPIFKPHTEFNWYFFGGIETRYVARNIFLDGNTFQDSHSVEKKPIVGDLQIGVAFCYRDIRFAFSNLYRTKEFEGQIDEARYGAINLTVHMPVSQ